MSEDISTIFYGLSFFLWLIVLVSLWWVTAKFPVTRRLWGLLALEGTLNLISDLA